MHPLPPAEAYSSTSGPPSRSAPGGDTDLELVRRMAQGDETALGNLHDRWAGMLYSVALRVTRYPDDAEEVVEEAFWQAWRQAGRFEVGRGGVGTWLTMIVRSRALDRARARGRVREEAMEVLPEPRPEDRESHTGPAMAAEVEERRRLVVAAVAQLPPEQRQTVEMAYFGGLSQSEIAEALGQPLGTVKTRARLALQKLRDTLGLLREEG